MYTCIAYCYNELYNDRDISYRIYDTKTNTYKDMHYVDICNALSNGTVIGNIRLKGKKIVGDNIDIRKLSTPHVHDKAIIIGYIKDKNGNTLGYDIIWQTGNRSYCTYNMAVHMLMNERIVNAVLVNKRVRLSSTRVIGERVVDANRFNEQAYYTYKERREAVDKRDSTIYESSFRIVDPKYKFMDNDKIAAILQDKKEEEEHQRKIERGEIARGSVRRGKSYSDDSRMSGVSGGKAGGSRGSLLSAMLKEYATPGPFQTERAMTQIFKS